MTDITAHQAHLGEQLQDLLDDRLAASARAQVGAHLRDCSHCRREFETLRRAKHALAAYAKRLEVPAQLGESLSRALDREDLAEPAQAPRSRIPLRPRWALGFGLAAVVAIASASLWFTRSPARLPAAVAQDFFALQSGQLLLEMRTTQPHELESAFASRNTGFKTQVYDLAMMGYRLAGGRVHRLQGRPSTLYVYEAPGGERLMCEMYEGRLDELPAASETLEHRGVTFRVYREAGLTAVFWQEGEVVCVLISDLDSRQVIELAFAKATLVPT